MFRWPKRSGVADGRQVALLRTTDKKRCCGQPTRNGAACNGQDRMWRIADMKWRSCFRIGGDYKELLPLQYESAPKLDLDLTHLVQKRNNCWLLNTVIYHRVYTEFRILSYFKYIQIQMTCKMQT